MIDLVINNTISIPLDLTLAPIVARYIYTRLPSRGMMDKYPEKMREIVQKVRDLITPEIYADLTQEAKKIIKFPEVPGWVVKGSPYYEILHDFNINIKGGEGLFCKNSFKASNCEGAVYRKTISLASRVENAKIMRHIIKTNNLQMIHVPKKYYCSYPAKVVPFFSLFYNQRYFALAEMCEVENRGFEITRKELSKLDPKEQEQLGRELVIFLRHSGVIDFHPANYRINDKKFVLFDTEPFSLTLQSRFFCVSTALKEARVNYENVICDFSNIPEAKEIVDNCDKAMKKIHLEEFHLLVQMVTIVAVIVLNIISPSISL